MSQYASDQIDLTSVLSVLAACTVQTLSESDPTFRERWAQNAEKIYVCLDDLGTDNLAALEVLKMTLDALKIYDQPK